MILRRAKKSRFSQEFWFALGITGFILGISLVFAGLTFGIEKLSNRDSEKQCFDVDDCEYYFCLVTNGHLHKEELMMKYNKCLVKGDLK